MFSVWWLLICPLEGNRHEIIRKLHFIPHIDLLCSHYHSISSLEHCCAVSLSLIRALSLLVLSLFFGCRKNSLGPHLMLNNRNKVGVGVSRRFDVPHYAFGARSAIQNIRCTSKCMHQMF